MIVSNDVHAYSAVPMTDTISATDAANIVQPSDSAAEQDDANRQSRVGYVFPQEQKPSPVTSSRVLTESDGSTVMQYTTIAPGGAMMRKNIRLHDADAFTPDPLNPSPMLRRRSDVYESMMQIF